jgi:hypothetical protein
MKAPIPDRIKNKPYVKYGHEFWWQAYMDLSTERINGMGEGAIPWSAVMRYGMHYGCNFFDLEDLWEIVKHMDVAYLKHREKKMKSKQPSSSKGKGIGKSGNA